MASLNEINEKGNLANAGEFAIKIDSSGTTTYIGQAKIGTATSTADWQIQKISESGTVTTFTWADGNTEYDNIWDNRASLSYS